MDHHQLREALFALHDGELEDAERKEVLAHLQECEGCRQDYRRWERIEGIFFCIPAKPSAVETEFFVRQMMENLEEQPSVDLAQPGWVARWMIPVLSMGVAALFLSIFRLRPESIAPMDVLFLMDSSSGRIQELVLSPDPSREDPLLDFIMEES